MAELDAEACDWHVSRFERGCQKPQELFWVVPLHAACAFIDGDDPVPIVEVGLAELALSQFAISHLHVFRSLYRNLPPRIDVDAARQAVECATNDAHRPVAPAFLAMALREDDPEAALDALRCAEALAEQSHSAFTSSTVTSFGSMAVLALPTDQAAQHLRERLDRLEPHWDTSAAALLSVCISVLQRVDAAAVAALYAFVRSRPDRRFGATPIASRRRCSVRGADLVTVVGFAWCSWSTVLGEQGELVCCWIDSPTS
jgi:hypothetical protein